MTPEAFDPPVDIRHLLPPAPGYVATDAFRRLLTWWRGQATGVCWLAGIGGGGKTAAADEFLRRAGVLGMRAGEGAASVPAADVAFVFTLQQGTPDALVDDMRSWVPGPDRAGGTSGFGDLMRDLARAARPRERPILVVVDGFEVVQSNGGVEGVGRITDARLRDLVLRCAHGALPGVALLATSRLAPTDVEIQRLPCYTLVDVDAMDSAAAVELLRAGGVPGSRRELARIGESYGNHALTLSVLTQYAEQTGHLPDSGNAVSPTDVVRSYVELARSRESAPLAEVLSVFPRGTSDAFLRAVAGELGLEEGESIEEHMRQLTGLRMVTRSGRGGEQTATMHEVVRRAVLDGIEPARRRNWHSVIARLRLDLLTQQWQELDVSERFVGLEECLAHLAEGDDPMEAFLLYWQRIGNFQAIGHQASRFAWGEAACRTLNQGRPPDDLAPYLRFDPRDSGSALLGDWGLYLAYLGEIGSALVAQQASYQAHRSGRHDQQAVSAANIADVETHRGALRPALGWARTSRWHAVEASRQAEGFPTAETMRAIDESFSREVPALLYTDGAEAAKAAMDELADTHAAAAEAVAAFNRVSVWPLPDPPQFHSERFQWGRPAAAIALVRGDVDQAVRIVDANLERWRATGFEEESTSADMRLLLARATLRQGGTPARLAGALVQIQAAESWARAADALPTAAEVCLLRAELALAEQDAETAMDAAHSGLEIARESGLGVLHVDLLVALGRAALLGGQPEVAAYAAATALFGQEPLTPGVALYRAPARDERTRRAGDEDWYQGSAIQPPQDTGRPVLLAVTHPDCGYRWGESPARMVLAEAVLAQLARHSGTAQWSPDHATAEAVAAVEFAVEQLQRAADLLDELAGSPDAGDMLRARIAALRGGVLTTFSAEADLRSRSEPDRRPTGPARALISYSHEDGVFVDQLADELQVRLGDIWLDRRRISVGQSFVAAINDALADVTHFIVVLSPAADRSRWVRNELGAAIALRNSGRPLAICPVLLDGVVAPPLIADLDAVLAVRSDPAGAAARLAAAASRAD